MIAKEHKIQKKKQCASVGIVKFQINFEAKRSQLNSQKIELQMLTWWLLLYFFYVQLFTLFLSHTGQNIEWTSINRDQINSKGSDSIRIANWSKKLQFGLSSAQL